MFDFQSLRPLFAPGVADIVKVYKISDVLVWELLQTKLAKNTQLVKLSLLEPTRLVKRHEFKDFMRSLRKDIYYKLRTYRSVIDSDNDIAVNRPISVNALAKTHISTKERLPFIEHFNAQLLNLIGDAKTILDLGGGLYPLIFPFEKFPKLEKYVWLDKDKKVFNDLQTFAKAQPKLQLINEEIGTRDWPHFDVVLMLKLIPVIYRQKRVLLSALAQIPAHKILVTASKEAMTKHQNIRKREDVVLKKFIDMTGKKVATDFETENEFGYLLI